MGTAIANAMTMNMNRAKVLLVYPESLLLLAAGGLCMAAAAASAQNVQHLTVTQPGGMPAMPIITSITTTSNQVTVTWRGFLGGDPMAPFRLLGNATLKPGQWQVLASVYSNSATVPLDSSMTFRIAGGAPEFAGAAACVNCHTNEHATWTATRHAGALTSLQRIGQGSNPSCLPCHTVGYGMPTGFTNETMKSLLGGVQCENCHGPAALHIANPRDPTTRPIKEQAAQLCGGCHMVSRFPTFGEWKSSGHGAGVVEDMNPSGRINGCGRCHSGSARLALLRGENPVQTVTGDANVGIECVVCHDPHRKANPAQLRNPLASTKDYFLSTSDVFTNKYDATINVCGQCHNHRGASWSSTSRPPHHSPQYNMLLGTVGELTTGASPNRPAAHALQVTNQCVDCHMQMTPAKDGPPEVPAVTGHKFKVESYEACRTCHPLPEPLTQFVTTSVSNRVQQIKTWLNLWATTKAPTALQTKYGVRAWEYSTPGTLSNPPGVTNAGPTTAEQAQIPNNIKKARFNLYLVLYDGSYGVHNGPHAITLLDAAESWLQQELKK
jgi:hypothetical protein